MLDKLLCPPVNHLGYSQTHVQHPVQMFLMSVFRSSLFTNDLVFLSICIDIFLSCSELLWAAEDEDFRTFNNTDHHQHSFTGNSILQWVHSKVFALRFPAGQVVSHLQAHKSESLHSVSWNREQTRQNDNGWMWILSVANMEFKTFCCAC